MKRALCAAALTVVGLHAQAGEVYGGIGLPGVMIGYAQPVSQAFTLRADVSTLGNHSMDSVEEGISYTGTLKTTRVGAFADWFPGFGSFRVTGGLTFNQVGLNLTARPGAGQSITVGDTSYNTTSADDRLEVEVKFPSTMPYIGIGFGHQKSRGFGFVADLGVSIGRAKVSATGYGVLSAANVQADIDREVAQLRDGVGKIRVLPQISIGLSYSF